jgi:hypothetical protein
VAALDLEDPMFRRSLVLAFALSLLLVPMTAFAQDADAQITIVHGALFDPPDVTLVDVYVLAGDDDFDPSDPPEPALAGFEGGDIEGPLPLPAGTYRVVITAAGDPADGFFDGDLEVTAGLVATVVATYDETLEGLDLVVFEDDLSQTACDEARVAIRHAALEGPVDVFVDGDLVDTISAGEQLVADLPADTYAVLVTASGDEEDVLFDDDVPLAAGVVTVAYAVTELDDDAEFVSILVDAIEVGEDECPVEDDEDDVVDEDDEGAEEDDAGEVEEIEQPTRVESGSGGLAGGLPTQVLLLALLGLALVTAPIAALRRR